MNKNIKDFTYFVIAGTTTSIVQIISLPLIIKNMTINEVSVFSFIFSLITILSSISLLGLDSSAVHYLNNNRFNIMKESLHRNILIIIITVYSLLYFCAYILSVSLDDIFLYGYLWGISIVLFQFNSSWAKYNLSLNIYILINTIYLVFFIIGVFFLLNFYNLNIKNIIIFYTIINLIPLLALYKINKLIIVSTRQIIIDILKFTMPFGVLSICTILIFSSDKIILYGLLSEINYALYIQQIKVASIFTFFITIFNFGINPILIKNMKNIFFDSILIKVHTLYIFFAILSALNFLSIYKILIYLLLGNEYLNNLNYIPIYIYLTILYGEYTFVQNKIIKNKSNILVLPSVYAVLVLAFVNILTTKFIGIYGALLAIMSALYFLIIFSTKFNNKIFFTKLQQKNTLLLLYIILSYFIFNFNLYNFYFDAIMKLLLVNILFLLIFYKYFKENLAYLLKFHE
jgi:O-antigen/teichoic acid export membrane protein